MRMSIFAELRSQGIGVQVNYIPAYFHPVFDSKDYPNGLCPVAEMIYREEISLPIHFGLSHKDQNDVTKILLDFPGFK